MKIFFQHFYRPSRKNIAMSKNVKFLVIHKKVFICCLLFIIVNSSHLKWKQDAYTLSRKDLIGLLGGVLWIFFLSYWFSGVVKNDQIFGVEILQKVNLRKNQITNFHVEWFRCKYNTGKYRLKRIFCGRLNRKQI